MGGLVAKPWTEELVVAKLVWFGAFLALLAGLVFSRLWLHVVSVYGLLLLHLVLSSEQIEALPWLMAYLVAPSEDECVSVCYGLDAVVVQVALVVPLGFVYEVVGLVAGKELLQFGDRLLCRYVGIRI